MNLDENWWVLVPSVTDAYGLVAERGHFALQLHEVTLFSFFPSRSPFHTHRELQVMHSSKLGSSINRRETTKMHSKVL